MKAIPIRARLTALYTLILAFSLCLFGGVSYFAMRHSIRTTVNAGLYQKIEGVRAILLDDAPKGAAALTDEFQEYADGIGKQGSLRVADAAGNILFASPGIESASNQIHAQRPSRMLNEVIAGQHFLTLWEPVEVSGTRYDVTVATSVKDFGDALELFRVGLYFAVPAFLVLAAFGGYWISGRALAPVDEMTQAARSIGAQELSKRLAVPGTGDELERLAQTLNDMLARLEAAFQRITQFTADASHELRTPVAVMRTSAELTLRKPRSEAEYREALAQILHESEKVSQLIEQLMVLARADAGPATLPLEPTDLSDTIDSACQQASLLAEAKQLEFCKSVPGKPLWVQGDSASLERLFLILLDNAVKYTPAGGRIEVHLGTENGFALAEIQDSGIGIEAADIPHVFDRFYRADRSRSRESGGTGLGLAIGRWIVEAHHGEICVESQPSKGSRFQVRLPVL